MLTSVGRPYTVHRHHTYLWRDGPTLYIVTIHTQGGLSLQTLIWKICMNVKQSSYYKKNILLRKKYIFQEDYFVNNLTRLSNASYSNKEMPYYSLRYFFYYTENVINPWTCLQWINCWGFLNITFTKYNLYSILVTDCKLHCNANFKSKITFYDRTYELETMNFYCNFDFVLNSEINFVKNRPIHLNGIWHISTRFSVFSPARHGYAKNVAVQENISGSLEALLTGGAGKPFVLLSIVLACGYVKSTLWICEVHFV